MILKIAGKRQLLLFFQFKQKKQKQNYKQIKNNNTMKKTLTKQDFINEFENSYRKDNFSTQGLEKLFDYFEQFEDETGEQIEMDIIAICCDYTEYENINELKKEYEIPSYLSNDKIIDYLNERTQVVSFEKDCILIQRY